MDFYKDLQEIEQNEREEAGEGEQREAKRSERWDQINKLKQETKEMKEPLEREKMFNEAALKSETMFNEAVSEREVKTDIDSRMYFKETDAMLAKLRVGLEEEKRRAKHVEEELMARNKVIQEILMDHRTFFVSGGRKDSMAFQRIKFRYLMNLVHVRLAVSTGLSPPNDPHRGSGRRWRSHFDSYSSVSDKIAAATELVRLHTEDDRALQVFLESGALTFAMDDVTLHYILGNDATPVEMTLENEQEFRKIASSLEAIFAPESITPQTPGYVNACVDLMLAPLPTTQSA